MELRAAVKQTAGARRRNAERRLAQPGGHIRLALDVPSPALNRARLAQPAAVPPACADRAEASRRRVRLAGAVVSPTLNRAIYAHGAGVVPAAADRAEAPRRRVRLAVAVGSPALDRACLTQPAGVTVAGR